MLCHWHSFVGIITLMRCDACIYMFSVCAALCYVFWFFFLTLFSHYVRVQSCHSLSLATETLQLFLRDAPALASKMDRKKENSGSSNSSKKSSSQKRAGTCTISRTSFSSPSLCTQSVSPDPSSLSDNEGDGDSDGTIVRKEDDDCVANHLEKEDSSAHQKINSTFNNAAAASMLMNMNGSVTNGGIVGDLCNITHV